MEKIDSKVLAKAARMLKSVSHPVRISMISMLAESEKLSVGEMQAKLEISQSMTSQHLSALRTAGILNYEKDANVCRYFIQNKNVLKLLECINKCAAVNNNI